MMEVSNENIISEIFLKMSEKLDKQLYMLDSILSEKDYLDAIEDYPYPYIAGILLQLNPTGDDSSILPELVREKNQELFEEERRVLLRYLNTLIHFEISNKHKQAYSDCVKMLTSTVGTFNQDFLNIVYLIVFFDGDSVYKNLCRPLATFCATILDNEYQKEISK